MRVELLGQLRVTVDGNPVHIGGARLRAMMICLALNAGSAVTVSALSDALWDATGPSDPSNAVHSLASRLRRVLPDASVLRSEHGGYRLELPPDSVDVFRFERLAADGRRALRGGDPAVATEKLRDALALWRGPALSDVALTRYAMAPAARLEELRLAAVEDRIEADLSLGGGERLVAELEGLTIRHPLRERLRGLLIAALAAGGRQAEALASYEQFRTRLADELGADPGPALRDLHLAVLRGEAVMAHPVTGGRRTGDSPRRRLGGTLPLALSSFIGRERELDRAVAQVRAGRLVTLVGPGGSGKSRLAIAIGHRLAGEVPGGASLVELAGVTEPDHVLHAIIAFLGLREPGIPEVADPSHDPAERLLEALSSTETLLILDNCEHLVEAVAPLVEQLLHRCGSLRVVATSREPLGIAGETLCPVPPLDVPEPAAILSQAMLSPAVRLFADRAASVQPDFTVNDSNVRAVVDVCRRLDGLPLAIELAAARMRSLPITHIAAHLDDRFRLLTSGSRTALPRHRTLRAVVAWSWDLLTDQEQRVARRLALFPTTITPEAAASVCGITAAHALDALATLADKSLLYLLEKPEPRYRMLETIREYALERLRAAGETAQTSAAHATHFRDLATQAEPQLRGADQLAWIAKLTDERDNLLAALHTCCDSGDADTALPLAVALGQLWTIIGNHAEASPWLRRVLELPAGLADERRTVVGVFYLLNTVLSGGRADATLAPVGTPPRDTGTHPATALLDPVMALIRDDTAAGLDAVERRLSHPESWTRGMLWLVRSFLDGNNGDLNRMAHDLQAAAEEFAAAGERWGLATSLTYLGYARLTLGKFDSAIAVLHDAIAVQRELNPSDDTIMQRAWIAQARIRAGDVPRARAELLDILQLGSASSSTKQLIFARIALGDLARHEGDLPEAAVQYQTATVELSHLPSGTELFRAMLAAAQAHLHLSVKESDDARRQLTRALDLAAHVPDMPLMAIIAVAVANLTVHDGDAGTSAEVLGAAHSLRGAPDAFNPDVVDLERRLRQSLGAESYRRAYARGCSLARAEAVALIEAQVRTSRI